MAGGRPSAKNVAKAKAILLRILESGGDSSLRRLHAEAEEARLSWVCFEEAKAAMNLRTRRRPDGRLAWFLEEAA